jgi:hypothetical protein
MTKFMPDFNAIRLVDKKILMRLNEIAERNNYNRQIVPEAITALPDTAIIAISPLIVHEHAAGKPVAAHARCRVYRVDTPEARAYFSGVFLDIPFDALSLLPAADVLKTTPPETPAQPKEKAKV